MKQLITVLASVAVLTACSSTPDSSSNLSNAPDSAPQASNLAASPKSAARAPAPSQTTRVTDVSSSSIPGKNSVYFDYDSSLVTDDYKSVVAAHARYLSDHRGNNVRVEGNTDERGSREYNLALGQRRADAVKQRLTLLGVPEQRIETVSFGEEKPRSKRADESAYAENRRADIVGATH